MGDVEGQHNVCKACGGVGWVGGLEWLARQDKVKAREIELLRLDESLSFRERRAAIDSKSSAELLARAVALDKREAELKIENSRIESARLRMEDVRTISTGAIYELRDSIRIEVAEALRRPWWKWLFGR